MDVWHNGDLLAESSTYTNLVGTTKADYLGNVLSAAQQVGGIEIAAWFEYGLISCYGSCQYGEVARDKGWELGSAGEFRWLDPSNAEFRDFFVNMLQDVKENYASRYEGIFKGIQLDDHFATPTQFGNFGSAMDTFAEQIANSIGRDWFSLAPNPMPQSRDHYNVDWSHWQRNGYHSEVVPQTYTASAYDFEDKLNYQLRQTDDKENLLAGIRCNGSGSNTSWSSVKSQIQYSNSKGIGGVVIWNDSCISYLYKEQFQSLWGSGDSADEGAQDSDDEVIIDQQ